MRLIYFAAAASLTLALLLGAALAATTISGAGATFPDLIYAKWAHAYKNETGVELIYRSIGSGGGIKQIEAKTVTFGATDKPLGEKELLDDGLVQFPMVMGGIVPVINVEGVKGGELVLDGATLAKIFLGEISKWDDAAIKTLNPTTQASLSGHRNRAPLGRLGHHVQLHQLSEQGERAVEKQSRV